ncbi:HET-domain-containing protein [Hypoxylon sp. FL0543]|nr:HET-domain-containing protein [Hypoxylon sp. FL0543]
MSDSRTYLTGKLGMKGQTTNEDSQRSMSGTLQDQLCINCSQSWNTLVSLLQCDICSRNAPEKDAISVCLSARDILNTTSCPLCRLLAGCLSHLDPYSISDRTVILTRGFHLFGSCWKDGTDGHHAHSVTVGFQCERWPMGIHLERPVLAELKVLEESAGDNSFNFERLFLDTPERCQPRGRLVPSLLDASLIRCWLQRCENNHSHCLPTMEPPKSDGSSEFRLIDVERRCIVPMPWNARYVALSYVWGQASNNILTTKTAEYLLIPGSLTEKNTPLTIYDAMLFTERIGERYLWVDSACILQDDLSDKHSQLPHMARIYADAIMVLCVASSTNADDGLPGVRGKVRQAFQTVETINGVSLVNVQTDRRDALNRTVWSSRGWTFQEAIVSRRALIFTEHQVYWICPEEFWCEDSLREVNYDDSHTAAKNFSFWKYEFAIPCFPDCAASGRGSLVHCTTGMYCQRVTEFSGRQFTNESDVFWAFTGFLHSIKANFRRGFLWAMPLDILDFALLWNQNCTAGHHSRSTTHITAHGSFPGVPEEFMKFPSWSWLSVSDGVYYEIYSHEYVRSEVQWHPPIYYDQDAWFFSQYPCITRRPDQKLPERVATEKRNGKSSSTNDLALLDLTGQIARLELRIADKTKPKAAMNGLIRAEVYLPAGPAIGTTWAEPRIFSPSGEFRGEFLLLSSYDAPEQDSCPDEPDLLPCIHKAGLNVMIISRPESGLTSRISLVRFHQEVWARARAKRERVILV